MGNKNVKSFNFKRSKSIEGQEKDLPEISLKGITDKYRQFELQLPFAQTYISRFMQAIDNAENECGNKGFVTIETLSSKLTTPAWEDLK